MSVPQRKAEIRVKSGHPSQVVPREAYKVTPVCTIVLLFQVAILASACTGFHCRLGGQTLPATRGYQSCVRSSVVPTAKALWALLLRLGRQVAYAEHSERVLASVAIRSNPRTHKLPWQVKGLSEKASSYYV